MLRPSLRTFAGALLVCAWLSQTASAEEGDIEVPLPPDDGLFIHDGAALLGHDELQQIRTLTEETRRETGVNLALVTVAQLPWNPKEFSVETLNVWRTGRRSVLLLVSMAPRKLYIQPGTDLAPRFDEEWSSDTCRNLIAPKMRAGQFFEAIHSGLTTIRDRALVPEPPLPLRSRIPWKAVTIGGSLGLVVALAMFLMRDRRRRCPQCNERMDEDTRILEPASHLNGGRRQHTFHCTGCSNILTETEYLPILGKTWSDSSSSSDSSWGSGSSSSSDSSGSSSSSDSSGGGGSDW